MLSVNKAGDILLSETEEAYGLAMLMGSKPFVTPSCPFFDVAFPAELVMCLFFAFQGVASHCDALCRASM